MFDDKRYILIILSIILSIILTIPINRLIVSSIGHSLPSKIEADETNSSPSSLQSAKTIARTITKRPLIPTSPAKYGIVDQTEETMPRNQLQWDLYTEKVLVKSKALDRMDEKKAFAGIKKTSREFKKRMNEINDQIKMYEKIKRNNPADPDAENKLESLYMLKATLTALESKIVIKSQNK